jgi:hypothetical protein
MKKRSGAICRSKKCLPERIAFRFLPLETKASHSRARDVAAEGNGGTFSTASLGGTANLWNPTSVRMFDLVSARQLTWFEMIEGAEVAKRQFFAWRDSRKVQLSAIGFLAGVVLIRLGLMTYWSLNGIDYAFSYGPLLLAWCLGLIVLAMLFRFAWQIWNGRHRTESDSTPARVGE